MFHLKMNWCILFLIISKKLPHFYRTILKNFRIITPLLWKIAVCLPHYFEKLPHVYRVFSFLKDMRHILFGFRQNFKSEISLSQHRIRNKSKLRKLTFNNFRSILFDWIITSELSVHITIVTEKMCFVALRLKNMVGSCVNCLGKVR